MKLHFEKNLAHQTQATEAVLSVLDGVSYQESSGPEKHHSNPTFLYKNGDRYARNILSIQEINGIDERVKRDSNIIDVMMETGTGKTYTYTKTIFELNARYGVFKFIVVVPTLAIKAGTINFLKSESARDHFRDIYGKTIQVHVVESIKTNKRKKVGFPPAVASFVNANRFDKNRIHVLIINAGMINSQTMKKFYDHSLFDKYNVPFAALVSVNPFVIVDEPHKFPRRGEQKTWKNIQEMKPQFILRYGATFKEYENLVYTLTAVDAFNRNLVKGVTGHIIEDEQGKNAIVRLKGIRDKKEASFELVEGDTRKSTKLIKKESLSRIHPAMEGLYIENMNSTTVLLSNGLELKKGDKINPYSYDERLQEQMIRKAVRNHFEIERELLKRETKIKPLTLFFIDNIEEYRSKEGYIRQTIEEEIKREVERIAKEESDTFYKTYLEKTLEDVSKTHGGYFAEDRKESDEVIEKEINEILYDKNALLDLNNTRRFIFSKWTLKEGWDNPNVFQICKLRSSGSEISKLQEVGRGLRLPVNEYGNRVKEEQFYLHYFVDFTESDFVEKLRKEINEKSGAFSPDEILEKLTDEMIEKICEIYNLSEEELLNQLDEKNVITRSNTFKESGFEYIKKNFSLIFEGVGDDKIRIDKNKTEKVTIRAEKYPALRELWEKLNEKVILEYKFKDEEEFKTFFVKFMSKLKEQNVLHGGRLQERTEILTADGDEVVIGDTQLIIDTQSPVITHGMRYSEFLKKLSQKLKVNIKTLHDTFVEVGIELNPYLNQRTIRIIEQAFKNYFVEKSLSDFKIEYKKVGTRVHPTKFTDKDGNVLGEIPAYLIGTKRSQREVVASNYFFNELFYDSDLEKENITSYIEEVVVFTKIPKNSIKIPIAGGETYSPDFAYVINYKDGKKKLYFVVESKDVDDITQLRTNELQKIKHAEELFRGSVEIKFRKQLRGEKIEKLIKEVIEGE